MDNLISLINALAWPITVLIVISIFRSELGVLLSRLSQLRYKEFEANFKERLSDLEKQTHFPLEPAREGAPSKKEEMFKKEERFSTIANVAPRSAIMQAWIAVEKSVLDAAERVAVIEPERRTNNTLMRELVRRHVVDDNLMSTYNELRALRNEAAHQPDFVKIHEEEAERYAETASKLAQYITRRSQQKNNRNGQKSS